MAVYQYKALDANQRSVRGTVVADTPRQARDVLRERELQVLQVNESTGRTSSNLFTGYSRRRFANQWATCTHELSMLIGAGIPLLEALDTVIEQHAGFNTALLKVRDEVAAGSSLSEAMRQRDDLFDPLSIHMVEVGENTGNLDVVLGQLSSFQRRMFQLKDRVLTALTYPAILVVFTTLATIFLMTYVMPALLENLQDTMDRLPWPTRVVKAISDALLQNAWWLVIAIPLAGIAAFVFLQTSAGRRWWHRSLLQLPLIGNMALKQSLSRSAMVIATLTKSGVVLTHALELAAKSSNNSLVRDALQECREAVDAGQDVAPALRQSGIFPPLAVRIFSVGQESGRLDEMLERLASDYDQEVATMSSRLTALLEPVLIILLSVLVGFVLLATILPILEAGNVL